MENLSDHDFFMINTLMDQFLAEDPLVAIPYPSNLQKPQLNPHEQAEKFKFAHHHLRVLADVSVAVGLGRALTAEEFAVVSHRLKGFLKDHGY